MMITPIATITAITSVKCWSVINILLSVAIQIQQLNLLLLLHLIFESYSCCNS